MKFRKKLYVQVFENLLQVRDIDELRSFQKSANPPFSHPRMLVGDFAAAEACLKSAISEALGNNIFLARPWVLIHPKEKIEGGLSPVEERVFLELAQSAGAAKVMVWVGHPLSDSEITDRLNQKSS